MRCIICGCGQQTACNHSDFGTCWWHSEEHAVCSHCADPLIIPAAVRTNDPNEVATAFTPYILRQFFKALDMKVKVSKPSRKHASYGQGWNVELVKGSTQIFADILEAHFDKCESTGASMRFIDPNSMKIRKETNNGK